MKEFMQIYPASAQKIRSWSSGEVKHAETLNFRSLKPEKGGLLCERIFGPVKDYECACGKYKNVKHKGLICDCCGVPVTRAKVRRERMGHIELAEPVVHPWYLHRNKAISDLLDIHYDKLVDVVYYHKFIVIDSARSDIPLHIGQVLDEWEYHQASENYGNRVVIDTGAAAILALLEDFDLKQAGRETENALHSAGSEKLRKKLSRRLQVIEYFIKNSINPADLILSVLPVMPADLRPMIPLEDGRFVVSELNDLYCRVISCNNHLKNLLRAAAPASQIRDEKRRLQEVVDALIDNGLYGQAVEGVRRPLESLTHHLGTGREWRRKKRFAQVKDGKWVDYSALTVAVPDSGLSDDTVAIPYKIAREILEPFLIAELKRREFAHTVRGAREIIERDEPVVACIAAYLIEELAVLVTHPPVINNLRARFFKIALTDDEALHLSVNSFLDMEFNKPLPFAKIFLPLSNKAQFEAKYLVNHPLRKKRRSADAHIILKMLEYDFEQKPLLCPSFEYAAALCDMNHVPVNTHIQLPEQIHTSIGGALLAMEFPDILSAEHYPETVEAAVHFLAENILSPGFRQLLAKYSYLQESAKSYSNEKIFRDEYIRMYDSGLIGYQKKKFAETLPVKNLDLESVYFSLFANLAYCTYCQNKSAHECSIKECPAHGLSGREKCLFYKNADQSFPVYGSAIGINAVYKLLEVFAETDMKSAGQMLYQGLKSKKVLGFNSMEDLENIFHFPGNFIRKEIELLFAIRKQHLQYDYGTGNFFKDAAQKAPDTILDAIFTGRKIDLTVPDAVAFSGNKPETCAIESAMKDDMEHAEYFLPADIDEPEKDNFLPGLGNGADIDDIECPDDF